jgi:tetratricopeptide (TPR) repeat protein
MADEETVESGGLDAGGGSGETTLEPEEYFNAGMFLFERGKYVEATVAFKAAFEGNNKEPKYMSYYGYCLVKTGKMPKEGIRLCELACKREFFRPELFLNLGRAYVINGNKRKAHHAYRKGLSIDRDNRDIINDLHNMGIRKKPVLPFLERKNPLNKLAGRILYKLWLR